RCHALGGGRLHSLPRGGRGAHDGVPRPARRRRLSLRPARWGGEDRTALDRLCGRRVAPRPRCRVAAGSADMTDLLRISVPLTAWLVAFSAVYGLHGLVCSEHWAEAGFDLAVGRAALMA